MLVKREKREIEHKEGENTTQTGTAEALLACRSLYCVWVYIFVFLSIYSLAKNP